MGALTVLFDSPANLCNIQVPPMLGAVAFRAHPVIKIVLPRPPTGPVYLTNDDWSAYLVDEDTGAAIVR